MRYQLLTSLYLAQFRWQSIYPHCCLAESGRFFWIFYYETPNQKTITHFKEYSIKSYIAAGRQECLKEYRIESYAAQSDVPPFPNQQSAHYLLKPTYLGTIGSEGSTSGKFFSPASVEYSAPNNRIYVSDLNNDRVQIFDVKGHYLSTLGASGTSDGQFIHPGDVAIDHNGDIYISDIGNNRIEI